MEKEYYQLEEKLQSMEKETHKLTQEAIFKLKWTY
jgi:hypothetical protein